MKKYFSFDTEYISGNTYFIRFFINSFLSIILVGLYLQSVNAYKRSRSLGFGENAVIAWAAWGFFQNILVLFPISVFTNVIPHFYLWFKNGTQTKKETTKKTKNKSASAYSNNPKARELWNPLNPEKDDIHSLNKEDKELVVDALMEELGIKDMSEEEFQQYIKQQREGRMSEEELQQYIKRKTDDFKNKDKTSPSAPRIK